MKCKQSFIAASIAVCMICGAVSGYAAAADANDRIYSESDVYNISFTDAELNKPVEKSDASMDSWVPGNFTRHIYISNGASGFTYGAVNDAPEHEGNPVLKISSPPTAKSDNYIEFRSVGMNPAYPSNESVSVGSGGYLDFSFDFYTDGKSDMKMAVGRHLCANDSEKITQVNKQTFFDLSTTGVLKVFGAEVATLETEKINNSWHNIRFILTGGNKYRVILDDVPLNELTNVSYGTNQYFRGVYTFRLYNIGISGVASDKYYDNFRYTIHKDVTDQYRPPQVKFKNTDTDTVTIGEGQTMSFSIAVESVIPDKIRVYLDGVPDAEYEGASAEYSYTGMNGTHIIEAEAIDALGAVSEKVKVTVIVTEKITIFGSFEGGSTSGSYSQIDNRAIGFDASCDDGLDRVEFFVNNVLAATSKSEHTDFDFSGYGAGTLSITAVVYDMVGKSKSFAYTAAVSLDKTSPLWSENYESYKTGNTAIGANIQIYHKNGYSRAVNIDGEHGTSFALGIEQDLGSDSGEYVNFANGSAKQHVAFETEFYVDAYPGSGADIRFAMVESSTVQPTAFTIGNTVHKGDNDIAYQAGEWNKLYIDFDMPNKRYSVYVNGETLAKDVDLAANFSSLNWIRCYGPAKDGVKCYIAFDNTSLSLVGSYGITSVCNNEGSDRISADDRILRIYLSEGIVASSLTADKVSVTGEHGSLRIGSVEYTSADRCIKVLLKDALIGGAAYTATLSGEIIASSGGAIGSSLSQSFRVENGATMAIVSAECDGNVLDITLSSATDKADDALIVISAWDGSRYCGIFAKPVTVQPETLNSFNIPIDFAAGEELQIFVTDSLNHFNMLTKDVQTVRVK